jgi:hypothetical protein
MNVAVLKDVFAGHESPKLVFKGLFVSGSRVKLALFGVCIGSWIINSVVVGVLIAVFGYISAAIAAGLALGFAFIGFAFEIMEALLYGLIERFLDGYGFIVTKARLGPVGYRTALDLASFGPMAVFAAFMAFIGLSRGVYCSVVGDGIGNFH